MVVAKVETWKYKKNLMKTKNKLKGTELVIDNDLTKARRTTIKYGKIVIGNVLWRWDRTEKKILRDSKNQEHVNFK